MNDLEKQNLIYAIEQKFMTKGGVSELARKCFNEGLASAIEVIKKGD